ncbi:hypothetical protein CDO52_04035 [Nocardiopsis gilva YIM 90087]|uniref:Uncharacterized protein n=1 Tax=Nocardiopsis gilva YIM 90087 TaxID=1235441 RepID=A0A223S1Q4_9ACTN|nr:hypothetical protein [Nocardiopsis gilva]ASU82060.1 hypothetical protein CDO52_04035 [Nocardiopsis gilva YIM 90087]
MSHRRLNNPRVARLKSSLANRVKHRPRHAFCAQSAISALRDELDAVMARPMYRAGCSDLAVMSVMRGINVWCRDGKFFWHDAVGTTVEHPANDPVGAAALLRPFSLRRSFEHGRHHTLAAA